MKQVLTQQEIDSLLSALSSGEVDTDSMNEAKEKDKIRSYDFRRPIKLSKEYVNTLHMIFENFSKTAGNLLSTQIRTNVAITLGAIEQVSFDEFIHSIPRFTLMGIFRSKPLSGTQILEINPQFCMQVIELMCGGKESKYEKDIGKKESFTDIELNILEETVSSILRAFEASWGEIFQIETKVDSIETNPQLIQSMSPNEPVILISFTVDVSGVKSFMNICIPYVSFENVIEKLSFRNWFDFEKESDDRDTEILSRRIMSLMVNLDIILGRSSITVEDFLELEAGDIIKLDIKTTDPLEMYVENKLHYLVRPGQVDGDMAVEVLQYIEEDVE